MGGRGVAWQPLEGTCRWDQKTVPILCENGDVQATRQHGLAWEQKTVAILGENGDVHATRQHGLTWEQKTVPILCEIAARRRTPHKHEVQGAPPHGIAALTSFALQVFSAGSAGSMSGSATTPTADGRLGEASSTAGSAATGGGQSDLAGKVLATPAWAACKWSAP